VWILIWATAREDLTPLFQIGKSSEILLINGENVTSKEKMMKYEQYLKITI
jgi:hypothetical protein